MNIRNIITKGFIFIFVGTFVCSCNSEMPEESIKTRGVPATADATIGNMNDEIKTRAVANSYDRWSTSQFNLGDVVGLYSSTGMQKPDDINDYTGEVYNGEMFFEGMTGTAYRFSNPDIVLDPLLVGGSSNYSMMYHPYYADMPDPYDSTTQKGMPLRVKSEGFEKCIDFMQTQYYYYTSNSSSTYYRIPLTGGVLQPSFYHYFSELVIQRGYGFDNPKDKRVWVVMRNPYTDIRIRRTSKTTYYTFSIQYTPDAGEDLMVTLIDDEPGKTTVNKYRVWEAWPGSKYNSIDSYYCVIPPMEVAYILIQDNNGKWQNVGDFYLSYSSQYTSKTARNCNRYIITIMLEGLEPVVKPVIIEDWTNGGEITDQSDAGIDSYTDFTQWLAYYNLYTETRNEALVEQLKPYGDYVRNTATDELSWTFYINNDIEFPNGVEDQILKLDDTLMGSSVYSNYNITNLRFPLVKEMGPNGVLKALNFNDLYLININGEETVTGGIVTNLYGGTIEDCNIDNGIIVSNYPSGMFAGDVTSGTLKNCNVSGQVIGLSTASDPFKGVFGTNPSGTVTSTGNNFKELYFETYY